MKISAEERKRRWRLILGGGQADGIGFELEGRDLGMDKAMQALYDAERTSGGGKGIPSAVRWLGDIREYFPSSVVQVMQADAMKRLNMKQMLLEPEMLAAVEPDVNLVSVLLTLKSVMPSKTRETARQVVKKWWTR